MNGHDLAPVLAMGIMFMIPIVAILTKHQQKMAIIMRTQAPGPTLENERLQREMADLKELMHQQAIAIDNLSAKVDAGNELSRRLENPVR